MRILLAALLVFAANVPAAARSIESEIKRILAKSDVVRTGFVGVVVLDDNGKAVVSINAGHLFTPASNVKLFSTALALERLGPEKRFETRVEIRGKDLVLAGVGDANLSLSVLDDLAAQIAAHSMRSVDGDIVGDDTAFLYEPYAASWTVEDTEDGDGPATSALVVNDNVVHLRIRAGNQIGVPAVVTLDPDLLLFPLDAQVATASESKIESPRLRVGGALQVRGTVKMGEDVYSQEWSAGDPALFAALALKAALVRRGIPVNGAIRALHREEGVQVSAAAASETIARQVSLPLIEDLRLTNKQSQNLHADLLLSDVAGSRAAGLEALSDFLSQIGIKPGEYRFYDGSGLSRSSLVTPNAVVALLRYMAHSTHSEDWFTTLPIAGVDGSLEHRLEGKRTKGRIRAKTGTLNHVSALSGYAEAKHEKVLTFSIFINNSLADADARRDLIDRICVELVR